MEQFVLWSSKTAIDEQIDLVSMLGNMLQQDEHLKMAYETMQCQIV